METKPPLDAPRAPPGGVRFARWVFGGGGALGLALLAPMYFLEGRIGADQPPPITHPEFFYGFVGVGLAWQLAFLIVASDPVRYRPMMLAGIVEKAGFGGAAIALFAAGRLAPAVFAAGLFDLTLGALFAASYVVTRPRR